MKGLIIKEWYYNKVALWMFCLWTACSLFLAFGGDISLLYVAMMVWFFNVNASLTFSDEKNKGFGETYEVLAVSRGQILSAKYAVQSLGLIFTVVLFGAVVGLNRLFSVDIIPVEELKVFVTIVLIGMIYESIMSAVLVGKGFLAIILTTIPSALVPIIFLSIETVELNINGMDIYLGVKGWFVVGLFAVAIAVYLLCWKLAVKKVSK